MDECKRQRMDVNVDVLHSVLLRLYKQEPIVYVCVEQGEQRNRSVRVELRILDSLESGLEDLTRGYSVLP